MQRQPAFDTFDGSLFAIFPSLNEEQTLQEVPTGLDSISHGNLLLRLDKLCMVSGSSVNKKMTVGKATKVGVLNLWYEKSDGGSGPGRRQFSFFMSLLVLMSSAARRTLVRANALLVANCRGAPEIFSGMFSSL